MKIAFVFSTGLTFATGTKPTVDKTACIPAQIIALVMAYFLPYTQSKKKKKNFTDKIGGDINEFVVIA